MKLGAVSPAGKKTATFACTSSRRIGRWWFSRKGQHWQLEGVRDGQEYESQGGQVQRLPTPGEGSQRLHATPQGRKKHTQPHYGRAPPGRYKVLGRSWPCLTAISMSMTLPKLS